MLKKIVVAVVCTVVLAVAPAWCFDLTVLHVNDTHSYLGATGDKLKPEGKSTYVEMGGWARLKTAVDQVRAEQPNVVLLHAGDAVQGDLYFMKYGGRPEMEFLDRLGFTAMTLGNHEFDKGPEVLSTFLGYASLPILSANMNAAQLPRLANRVKPYTVVVLQGEKVGIIGLTTRETETISDPGAVRFTDELASTNRYVAELTKQGVDKIILLTHMGFEADMKLAAKVKGVDIIVGGHSHTLLGNEGAMGELGKKPEGTYPTVIKGADGKPVYVVTAWKWAKVLGRLDVSFNDAGEVTSAEGKPVFLLADSFRRKDADGNKVELAGPAREQLLALLNENHAVQVVAPNPAEEAYLTPFTKGVEAMRNDVVGRAVEPMPHIRVPGVDESGRELTFGSLIAPHVCRAMMEKINGTGETVDMALQNGGGVRESVEQGNITVGKAYTLMPFGNTLVIVTMTGTQLEKALETGVDRSGGAFPYVAGARYTANMDMPEGRRITSVDIKDKQGRWRPLSTRKTYRVVTNSFVASGGDGYEVMKEIKNKYDTGFVDAQAFIEYVKRYEELKPLRTTGVTYLIRR